MNYETSIRSDDLMAPAPSGRRAWLARHRTIVIGAAVALVLLLWAGLHFLAGSDAAAPTAEQAPTVTVAVARQTSVRNVVNATGTLAARRDMPVGVVGEGGSVTRVLVEPGDWVAAGQVLATVERSVQAQDVRSLAASVAVARADAKLAEADLVRARALVGNGFVSKADLDRKTATRDAAVARVAVAVAQLDQARARLGRLDIRAPARGLVLTRTVEPGQVVSGGGGTLFRVARDGELELQARVSETDLVGLRVGSEAQVTPVGSRRSFTGRIWQLSPVIDPQTRQGTVKIALPYDTALRPGGFASVALIAGQTSAPLLPESAIQSDDQGAYVYIVDRDSKVRRRAVRTGPLTADGVSIVSGLRGDERVVLYAAGFLNPGETVKPRLAGAAAR